MVKIKSLSILFFLCFSSLALAQNKSTGLVTVSHIVHWLGAGTIILSTEEEAINASSECANVGRYIIDPRYLEPSLAMLLSAQAAGRKVELVIGANCYENFPQVVAIVIPT